MKRFISIAISLTILILIYWRIDFGQLVLTLRNSNVWWMIVAIGMVIPLTLSTAWRLQQLMPTGSKLGFGEANRLILAASGLNMVLPSKMGDIAKAYFMQKEGHLSGSLALSLVIFEKKLKQQGLDAMFVANVHDEWQLECSEADAKKVGDLGVEAIVEAGKELNLNCPLDGDYNIGDGWHETH